MEYGQLVQKLLALAFLEAGATRVTERSTQGIDLEVELADGRRAALEVKTSMAREGQMTGTSTVAFGKKDVAGLVAREAEGYEPYLAVLGAGLLDDWIFARYRAGELRAPASCSPTRLRAYRDLALEQLVKDTFVDAVMRHATTAIEGGQGALDEVLGAHPAYSTA